MKTTFKLWGIIALVAMIGLGVIACDNGTVIHVTGVELSYTEILLVLEQEQRFSPIISPDNASDKAVTWSSSDTSKVTVTPVPNSSDVTIKAVAVGEATITVTTSDGGETAECVVTVMSVEDAKTAVEAKEEKDRWAVTGSTMISGEYDGDAYKVTVNEVGQEDYYAFPYYQYVADESTESYYLYTFTAKTQSGTRMLRAAPAAYCVGFTFEIGETPKEYTFASNEKLVPGIHRMEFWCANELGTFFISDVTVKAITIDYLDSMPLTARWSSYTASSKTEISHSIDNDGVVTIIVTGQTEQHSDGVWNAWMAAAQYQYFSEQGKAYAYTFEAWTDSGTRRLRPQYYGDPPYLLVEFDITSTRTTYTVYGDELPIGGIRSLDFHSADQLGTYYVKILSIEPYTPRKLTITGIPPSLGWMEFTLIGEGEYKGDMQLGEEPLAPLISFAFTGGSSGRTITNGSVTFIVFSFEEWDYNSPKFGSKAWDETDTGKFHIYLSIWGGSGEGNYFYTNGAEFDANKLGGDDYKYDFSIEDSVTIDFSKFKPRNYYMTIQQ